MDTKEVNETGEVEGAKRLSAEQPIVPPEEEENPKEKGVKFIEEEEKKANLEKEYASDVSESSEVIRNEFRDMYGESEEDEEEEELDEMEEEGEEEEEEEASEEEDLSEFKLQLEEKYMKGIEFSEEYLIKENQKIEDVPLQIYAIEIYINSIRTFYGFANHWIRLKVFDSPCFEIRPCNKVNAQASMYANMSVNQSKGSVFQNESEEIAKMDLADTEILTQKKKNKMVNKRLDFDLSNLSKSERRRTIDLLMREEVKRGGTDFITESALKIQSKEKDVGLDIPLIEMIDDEDMEGMSHDERRGSKTWILREPLENGKTVMFPMRPSQFIHKLQRQPLKLFVMSTSGMMSSAQVELSGLTEAVIRACKGPPYPISSVQRFNSITSGDFTTKIVGTVRVIAIGPQNISSIKCEDNINEQVQRAQTTRKFKPPVQTYNMDSQEDKPSILTGPQKFTLYDVVKNIRKRRQKEKYQEPPKPAPKRYYVEDLVFNRAKNTITRAPKKTYESLRAEIDRYLVLNKSRKDWPEGIAMEEQSEIADEFEDERSTLDEEVEEEEEIEEEHDEKLEGEETAKRVEAVFHSLIQVYGQNWANYKPKTSPSSSTSVVHERMTMKQDDSKISSSSSPIWRRFGDTNPDRRKH